MNTFEKPSGIWDLPKGGLEEGDLSLEDAVIRELFEETGTDKYIIKQKLPEKILLNFNEEIRKRIGFERQETTMFFVEFVGNQDDFKLSDTEINGILLVDSENLMDKLSHEATATYVKNHSHFLLRGTETLL